jgi:iron-sulfur cluster assembly protein
VISFGPAAAAAVGRQLAMLPAETRAAVRIRAEPGGCAGPRYRIYFGACEQPGDDVVRCGAFTVQVDKATAGLIRGSVIDLGDPLKQEGLTIRNPNVRRSCPCTAEPTTRSAAVSRDHAVPPGRTRPAWR